MVNSNLQLTTCSEAVTRWHLKNDPLLNPSKSNALITGSRHQEQSFGTTPGPGLCIASSTVPFVNNIRLSGVIVDYHLANQLKFGQRASSVAGPRIWNQLPTELETTI